MTHLKWVTSFGIKLLRIKMWICPLLHRDFKGEKALENDWCWSFSSQHIQICCWLQHPPSPLSLLLLIFFQDGLYLWAAKFFPPPVLFLVSHLSMTLFVSLSSLVLTYKLLVVSSGLSRVPQSTSRRLVLVQERSGFSIVIWEGARRMFIKQWYLYNAQTHQPWDLPPPMSW